mmetsp:Transcript_9395/g.19517  ORF Transcript_9395/g.19517 Transcript_9395/m.19517 type:complete len:386 (+) Transcript_9395:2415-3572(+)
MQKLIGIIGEIVVDHHVDTLNIDTTSKQVGGDQNARIEILEGLVLGDTFFLLHTSVDANGRKVAFRQQSVQFLGASNLGDKNDNLIEFEGIQQIVEFAVLFCFGQFGKVELETVQCEFGFIIDIDFHGILAKLFANRTNFFGKGGTKEQDLFFVGSHSKNFLNIAAHIQSFQDAIALIENEMFDTRQFQSLFRSQGQNTPGCAHHNVRMILGQDFAILFDVDSSIKDRRLDGRQIFGETFVLVGNLKGQFTSVAQDQDLNIILFGIFISGGTCWVELMQSGQYKNCRFSHSRFGLTDDVSPQDSLGDRFMLDFGGMLKTSIHNSTEQFWLEQKILKTRGVNAHVVTLLAIATSLLSASLVSGNVGYDLFLVVLDQIIFVVRHGWI